MKSDNAAKFAGCTARVVKAAVSWANSEPVLRSMTNGNLEGRPASELRLAKAVLGYQRALNRLTRKRQKE